MQVWAENKAFVDTHNMHYEAGLESFDLELNIFADLTNEEFTHKYFTKFRR